MAPLLFTLLSSIPKRILLLTLTEAALVLARMSLLMLVPSSSDLHISLFTVQ